ncbi:Receptor-type tyrosine-protein phosphatase gamma [Fasciola hepatica]|uniref:Receptor-type tyrosine-protein phosphatase gamma n=1 Tax=Fasciola hepatica TaxID=6192 RepID=A0A4E0RYK8_FASHE|nr:Receptor-type tyrosine-protein phosphatase gamma [Fasciola hepatica]
MVKISYFFNLKLLPGNEKDMLLYPEVGKDRKFWFSYLVIIHFQHNLLTSSEKVLSPHKVDRVIVFQCNIVVKFKRIHVHGENTQEMETTRLSDSAIPWSRYLQFFDEFSKDENTKFSKQYLEITCLAEDNRKAEGFTTSIGLQPNNMTLNQYSDTLPYDQCRVILGYRCRSSQKQTHNDYINASFIHHILPCINEHVEMDFGKIDYIATQGPLESTCGDFWRMMMEQGSTIIVMLTNLRDDRGQVCAQYWPERVREKKEFISDNLLTTVELVRTKHHEELFERKFHVQFSAEPGKQTIVRQLHMTSWPDMDVPDLVHFEKLLSRHSDLKMHDETVGPTVVHCRAGVGRTGTFIAADVLRKHLQTTNPTVNIPGIVLQLRRCRPCMIDNLFPTAYPATSSSKMANECLKLVCIQLINQARGSCEN